MSQPVKKVSTNQSCSKDWIGSFIFFISPWTVKINLRLPKDLYALAYQRFQIQERFEKFLNWSSENYCDTENRKKASTRYCGREPVISKTNGAYSNKKGIAGDSKELTSTKRRLLQLRKEILRYKNEKELFEEKRAKAQARPKKISNT